MNFIVDISPLGPFVCLEFSSNQSESKVFTCFSCCSIRTSTLAGLKTSGWHVYGMKGPASSGQITVTKLRGQPIWWFSNGIPFKLPWLSGVGMIANCPASCTSPETCPKWKWIIDSLEFSGAKMLVAESVKITWNHSWILYWVMVNITRLQPWKSTCWT